MNMVETTNKFNGKVETTHLDLFRSIYGELVRAVRILQEEFGEERVFKILSERRSEFARKWVEASMKDQGPISCLRDFSSVYLEQVSGNTENYQTFEVEEDSDERLRIRMKECIWADAFRALDAGDIGHVWLCQADFVSARGFHPCVKLKRAKTLMQGDDYCDMEYVWEGEAE